MNYYKNTNKLDDFDFKYNKLYNLIIEENKKQNLTKIVDKNEFFEKHIKDSLLGLEFINKNDKVLDIGVGAGFPSIPLAINMPDSVFTLIDCEKKRIEFIEKVIRELELTNVKCFHCRIEDFQNKEFYDKIVARAVAKLVTLVEYALPFLKINGKTVFYKSNHIENELEESKYAINILGGGNVKIEKKNLNFEIIRKFIIIEKITNSPSVYPRNKNKPKKKPLIETKNG